MPHINGALTAAIPFIRKSELYRTVKPYGADFCSNEVPRSNIKTHRVEDIPITDLRPLKDDFAFQADGFEIIQFKSSLAYEDWADQSAVEEIYCRELGTHIMHHLQASAIQIFEAQVRRRHPSFPHSYVETGVGFQPAMRPHIDASLEHTKTKVATLNGDEASNLLQKRWVYLNVWKPLKGPLRDWPLAICDPSTIQPDVDLLEVDNIIKGEHAENISLYFSEHQHWMYLSDQMPEELLMFRQADSDGNTGVPHAAFDLPLEEGEIASPRESVEVRMIAYF